MANGWGGKREGAGRPRGLGGRRRLPPEISALSTNATARSVPLERLLARIQDETLSPKYRDKLCLGVLPFLVARPSPTLTAKCSFEMTDEEINAVIAREEAYQRGELGQIVRFPGRRR